jgi:uncharacterized protein (DUF302 family)
MPTVKHSPHPFNETVRRLVNEISAAGFLLFTSLDQAAEARRAGLDLRPTLLLLFGNPRGGTPVMDAHPLAALALPLRFLVWEETGSVSIAYIAMAEQLAAYGVPPDDPRIVAMDRALSAFSDRAVAA